VLFELAIKTVRGLISVIACGPPGHIADVVEDWFTSGAADGLLIAGNILPRDLEVFVDRVVPILQQHGLFRTEYEASTLRGNLGLAEPGCNARNHRPPVLRQAMHPVAPPSTRRAAPVM